MDARQRTEATPPRLRPWLGRPLAAATFALRSLAAAALTFALSAAPTFVLAQEASRIGYVDMKRLIDNAPQMLAARERLRLEFDKRDTALKAEMSQLAALDLRLRNEAQTLPAPDLAALQRQADALRRSIERTKQRLQQELASRTDQELDRTWPLIDDAVADYAREAGLDLVVQSPVVFASGRIDITDRVLERLKREATSAQVEP